MTQRSFKKQLCFANRFHPLQRAIILIQGSAAAAYQQLRSSYTSIPRMPVTALHQPHDSNQLSELSNRSDVAANSSAASVWAGLTEVERTSLLVAFAR
jgi:hypothetical protein